MTTNLYLVLDEARTWAKARSVSLSISLTPEGGLVITGFKPGASEKDHPETAQWSLTSLELRKGLGIDPGAALGDKPKPGGLGAQLRFILGSPLGPGSLAVFLLDDDNEVTKAVTAKAAALRQDLADGKDIDPFQAQVEELTPKPVEPVEFPFKSSGKKATLTVQDLLNPRP